MKSLLVKSYAKINIGLNVCESREDGYHSLDMVMVPIEFHDSLLMKILKNRKTHSVTMDDYSCRFGNRNLVVLALDELNKTYNCDEKLRVMIHKNTPIQGGFGGGSSNAAAALKGANQLLNLNASKEDLLNIGLKIGSDVPFFIECKPMRCKGRGEEMTPISIKNDYFVVICKPDAGCSTKEVFAASDKFEKKHFDINGIILALESGDDESLAQLIGNDLEEAATSLVPEIKTIIDLMRSAGGKIVSMSGSGSGVFCMTTDKRIAKAIYKKLWANHYNPDITKIIK